MKSIPLLVFIHAVLMGQWETINQPDLGTVSRIISGGNGLIAATNQAQVYQSIDEGNSWQLLGDTLPTQPYGADLLFEKDNAVFFTQNIGEGPYNFRCIAGFSGWIWQELPHQSSALISMVANDSLIFTLLNGISISSDLGESWTAIPDPPLTGYIKLLFATNNFLYVSHGCQVYRTPDLGETWEDITGILDEEGYEAPYSCSSVMSLTPHGNQLMISLYWGGGLGILFVSDDQGSNWTVLNTFPVDNHVYTMLSKNYVIYAGTASSNSGLFYTGDLVYWTDFSDGLESYDLSTMQLAATEEYLFKTGSTINSHRIPLVDLYDWDFRLENLEFMDASGDGFWEPGETLDIAMELCNNGAEGYGYYPGATLEADSNLVTIQFPNYWFYVMDAGQCLPVSFSVLADSSVLEGTSIDFISYPTTLNCEDMPQYCIEGDTLNFSIEISSPTGIADESKPVSDTFALHPNFPNPFNPSTTLQFSIPERSHVTLKIYDVMGRDIFTLVDQTLSSGTHSSQWDGSNHPSGIYFLQLENLGETHRQKIILMK